MSNKVQLGMIAVLAVLSVYLMITNKNSTDSLKNEIRMLNAKLSQKDGECEAKMALLRAAAAKEKKETVAAENPVTNLLARLPVDPSQRRRDTVEGMKGVLKLTDGQNEEMKVILDDFRKEKMAVLARLSREKIFIWDPRFIDEINGVREKAMANVKSTLTSGQYEMFLDKGYDAKLGLRPVRLGSSNR